MENKKKNWTGRIEKKCLTGQKSENQKFFSENISDVDETKSEILQTDILQCERAVISDGLSVKGRINADGLVQCERLVADTLIVPIIEMVQVYRFLNSSEVMLSYGDVVALTAGRHLCIGRNGRVRVLLESVTSDKLACHRLTGVIIGNLEPDKKVGFGSIQPDQVGTVCIAGIISLVKVDSNNFVIDEGDDLFAGPNYMAVPALANRHYKNTLPRLGFALTDVCEGDTMASVMVGCF